MNFSSTWTHSTKELDKLHFSWSNSWRSSLKHFIQDIFVIVLTTNIHKKKNSDKIRINSMLYRLYCVYIVKIPLKINHSVVQDDCCFRISICDMIYILNSFSSTLLYSCLCFLERVFAHSKGTKIVAYHVHTFRAAAMSLNLRPVLTAEEDKGLLWGAGRNWMSDSTSCRCEQSLHVQYVQL